MRAEECRDQTNRLLLGQPAIDPQEPELGVLVEAVPALALDGGDAEREHLLEKPAGSRKELTLTRRAGLPHG